MVAKLVGDAVTSYTLTLTFSEIAAITGTEIEQEAPVTLSFRRGDATGNNKTSIGDAMFIAQYVVGNKTLDEICAVNAASVKHDSGGDKVTIDDAMYVAFRAVGLRDDNFNIVVP